MGEKKEVGYRAALGPKNRDGDINAQCNAQSPSYSAPEIKLSGFLGVSVPDYVH